MGDRTSFLLIGLFYCLTLRVEFESWNQLGVSGK